MTSDQNKQGEAEEDEICGICHGNGYICEGRKLAQEFIKRIEEIKI